MAGTVGTTPAGVKIVTLDQNPLKQGVGLLLHL
jgi:hypothetical protein